MATVRIPPEGTTVRQRLTRLWRAVRDLASPGSDGEARWRYGDDAVGYWNERHATHGTDELSAVGRIGLSPQEQATDYRIKGGQLQRLLRSHRRGEREQSLLDAGCGTGVFSRLAVDLGYQVVSSDFSEEALRRARARLPGDVETVRESLTELDLRPRHFDVVMSIDVLFHVVDDDEWAAAVTNLTGHVAPTGVLVIQENFVDPPPSAEHVRWRTFADYRRALPGWVLTDHVRYRLPGENIQKDLFSLSRARTSTRPGNPHRYDPSPRQRSSDGL